MTDTSAALHYTAFSDRPDGGNPAGVVLDASALGDEEMQAIAAELGYSESAFVVAREDAEREYDVRYFSPLAEVAFCGHATIATAVALAERDGPGELVFHTQVGAVPVSTDAGGATLTSPPPRVQKVKPATVDRALELLRWSRDDLDPALPPKFAFAGVHHLILAAATRERLADLDYDFDGLADLMHELGVTTIHLVWREDEHTFHARGPFAIAGVVEDPATGAAAAALGAYLRELGLITPPATVVTYQGEDLGRPSRLVADIRADRPQIAVTGQAVRM